MTIINYEHRQSAHCENGVTSSILRHHGLDISEPMVFGIGSGLFFGYAPFIKFGSIPLTTFRGVPGGIFKKAMNRLTIDFKMEKFSDKSVAVNKLDRLLENGSPVCCQIGIYWVPYFPEGMRFHFNAHNVVVYGKEKNEYLISDPVIEVPVRCGTDDFLKARFAKGPMAPSGKMYYPVNVPAKVDLRKPVIKGIKETCFVMNSVPLFFMGVRGIRFLAGRMLLWEKNFGKKQAARNLGNVIRMQEEIGTGGAGFRFIYAAFLQEAAELFNNDEFGNLSEQLTGVGDLWRQFAYLGSKNLKDRIDLEEPYEKLSGILMECAEKERKIFLDLRKLAESVKL